MKLNSSQLEAFLRVARTLNFTRAAEILHITQSALSQRIQKLEEELETTLFIRERSALSLTEAGRDLLRYVQQQEEAEEVLLHSLKSSGQELSGTLRLAGFSSVNRSLVLPALAKLMQGHERLSLKLLTKEIHELDALLQRAEADYIVTTQEPESQAIESIFLGYEENILVIPAKGKDIEIYLDHDERDMTTQQYFKQHKLTFKPKLRRYLDDVYGLIDGVKQGYGRAILPRHLVEREKALEIVDPSRVLKIPIYLQFYRQPFYRAGHEPLVSALKKHFAEQLG